MLIDRKGHVVVPKTQTCCTTASATLLSVVETTGSTSSSPCWKNIHILNESKSLAVLSSGTNQPSNFYYILFQHGFSSLGRRLMTWKFPQSQCLTKSLWRCVCQRICLKTHKPQTKQRLLKTRAVPELITNITLFGCTKPSFIPSRIFVYLCPSNQPVAHVLSCPMLRHSSCSVFATDRMTLLFLARSRKLLPACLCVVPS